MLHPYTFDCPQCGASLNPQGDAVQVQCEYCGRMVVVPEDLRPKQVEPAEPPSPAELLEQFAEMSRAQHEREAPHKRGIRESISSTIASIVMIGAILCICVVIGALEDKDVQQSIAGIIAPTSTPVPISRVLAGPLPRQVRYAGLVFTVKQAEISNRDPAAKDPTRAYRSDHAFAVLDLAINNTVATRNIFLDASVPRLQLGDAKLYKPSDGWHTNYDPQTTTQTKLVFVVPIDATWSSAQLILSQPNKEPATLALDAPGPAGINPVAVKDAGQATADQIVYRITSAALDLDNDGARADIGKRFLRFAMHLTNNSTFVGGVAISGNDFRLLVDGDSLAPVQAPIQVLNASSSLDGDVVFLIPASFNKLELQVGELGHATTKIPLSLKPQ